MSRLVIIGKAEDVFAFIKVLALVEVLDTWVEYLTVYSPIYFWLRRN